MAAGTLADLNDALSQIFAPMLARQANRQAVGLSLIQKMSGGGKNLAWDVTFNGHTGDSSYTEGADVSAADLENDIEEDAILSWALRRRAFGVTSLARKVASSSVGNAREYLDIIAKKAVDSGSRLLSDMNSQIYNGTGAGNIIGLESALAITGTYAGVSKVTFSEWRGTILANAGTPRPLTKSLLDQLDAAIFTASGRTPTVFITTPGVAQKYENLIDAITRTMLETGELSPRQGVAGQPLRRGLDNGFTGLHYRGIPFYRDKDVPTGKIFALDDEDIEFVTVADDGRSTAQSYIQRMLSDEQDRPSGIMNVRLESLAKTGSSDRFMIELHPQLKVEHPNRHGIIEDIDES